MKTNRFTSIIGTPQQKLEAKLSDIDRIMKQVHDAKKAAIDSALKAIQEKRKKADALCAEIAALEQLVETI